MRKYKTANGYTKAKMIETIKTKMLDHRSWHLCGILCAYLAEDGNRCAIGCFIPDGHIALLSLMSVNGILTNYPDLKNFMPLESKVGLRKLQKTHDRAAGDPRLKVLRWIETYVKD